MSTMDHVIDVIVEAADFEACDATGKAMFERLQADFGDKPVAEQMANTFVTMGLLAANILRLTDNPEDKIAEARLLGAMIDRAMANIVLDMMGLAEEEEKAA